MKSALIGYGYWGKILHSNIEKFLNTNVVIHDPVMNIDNMRIEKNCGMIFVATPAQTHYNIVKDLLNDGKNVFCEKPLSTSIKEVSTLYDICKTNKNAKLFVDWTFTFNDAVKCIKEIVQDGRYGKIRNVEMNRLNSGPERKDTCAKWDLASHDVSILQYIFEEKPEKVDWVCLKRNKDSFKNDTCYGVIQYENFDASINCSWQYGRKNRSCVFEFDAGFLHWDDSLDTIFFENNPVLFKRQGSPLENALKTFASGEYDQEKLTKEITEILENE